MYFLMITFTVSCMVPRIDAGASVNNTKTLINDLMATYSRYIRPVEDQDDVLNVNVTIYLKTVKEFDEVQGTFSFTGALLMSWPDALLRWDPAQYGGMISLKHRYKEVWVPDMVLLNPAEDADTLGKPWQVVEFYFFGLGIWNTGGLIKTSCEINVRYYPFDTQICEAQFVVWGYKTDEVRIIESQNKANISLYTPHPSWELVDTSTESWNFSSTYPGFLVRMHLKRKPEFVIINIIMPISFLSLLNIMVFVLVPESGERVSYSITVLLAVAVFLTIVSDTLPKSSEPIPLISYKLMADMVISSVITFMTILNLHFYHKNDDAEVPATLQALYRCLTSRRCRTFSSVYPKPTINQESVPNYGLPLKKNHADVLTVSEVFYPLDENTDDTVSELAADVGSGQGTSVTWRQVSRMLDWISLIIFTFVSVFSFAFFLLMSF